MKRYLIALAILCLNSTLFSQESMEIIRTNEPITIDGKFDEPIWQKASVAKDFKQYRPNPGTPKHDTEVRVVYDDDALYIAAYMKDSSRDSIMTQLTERDDIGNTDFFGFFIDTYKNGTDALEFIIASTGVQFDAKLDANNEDQNWDAVWFSEVRLTDHGWYAEFKIPYSAIRFPKKDVQAWNINFFRRRSVSGTQDGWVFIDMEQDNPFLTQIGEITGIKDIKPPLRLSLSPYASFYVQQSHDKNRTPVNSTGYSYNGGLDLKYGINDAFTLDMTLIPDFGQVQSDDAVLNLSPFEVRFDEQRQFFTEGTELFNKAGLFYSRRVGGTPIGMYDVYDRLGDTEEVSDNPQSPQLYNATKISGRNSKGLGVGIFNALSAETNATITDIETDVSRSFQTSPITNYNVIVLDQNLKNNSSVTFTNTNVKRFSDNYHSANVSAINFNLKNKGQSWGIQGDVNYSQILNPDEENVNGHYLELDIERLNGTLVYGISYEETSDAYRPNDLGFLRFNNYRELSVYGQYRKFDGLWKFNQFQSWFNIYYERLYNPNKHIGLGFNGGFWGQGKNQWNYNLWTNYRPERNDFYEPRQDGRFYKKASYRNMGFWIGTDNRKKLRLSLSAFAAKYNQDGRHDYQIEVSPRFRFNDKFSVFAGFSIENSFNDEGYVNNANESDIIFGRRNVNTISNRVNVMYTFNNKMSLNFRLRHYWSKVNYKSYHTLMDDGYLKNADYNNFHDLSFNAFNIDMVYKWRFAPGSDIFFVWKNNISGSDSDINTNYEELDYKTGLTNLNALPQNNSISIRVVYYLDYANLKNLL